MGDYRKLKVWDKSHALALVVYRVSGKFPAAERYGLTAQVRRSAVSVNSNIVEGATRQADGDMLRFLQIARASLAELQYQLLLARDLEFLVSERYEELALEIDEISRMLIGLMKHLRKAKPRREAATA